MSSIPDQYEPIGDPLIDEVRELRFNLSKRLGHDVGKLCDHLIKQQRKHGNRLESRNPLAGAAPGRSAASR